MTWSGTVTTAHVGVVGILFLDLTITRSRLDSLVIEGCLAAGSLRLLQLSDALDLIERRPGYGICTKKSTSNQLRDALISRRSKILHACH